MCTEDANVYGLDAVTPRFAVGLADTTEWLCSLLKSRAFQPRKSHPDISAFECYRHHNNSFEDVLQYPGVTSRQTNGETNEMW